MKTRRWSTPESRELAARRLSALWADPATRPAMVANLLSAQRARRRLSDEQAVMVISRPDATPKALAAELGCSPSVIRRIRHGTTYREFKRDLVLASGSHERGQT